jgi:hypothetical protein
VRRGAVKVGRQVKLEGTTIHVEQVDCTGDSIKVHLRAEPAAELTLKLFADGRRLQVLELELDEVTGRGRATAYPLMRTDASLRVELKGRGKGSEAAVDIPLP